MEVILPGSVIGIIGGGQLAQMLTTAAKTMGYLVKIYDQDEDAPAFTFADGFVIGSFDDLDLLRDFAKQTDVLLYEFENIDVATLEVLVGEGYCLPQGTEVLTNTQNRLAEKQFIEQNSVAKVAEYQAVNTSAELLLALDNIGMPAVLKTCNGGYDGKGQQVIKSADDIILAEKLLKHQCVLEKFVTFRDEYSMIVVRDSNGEVSFFPPAKNIHYNNILSQSWADSDSLDVKLIAQMEEIAAQLVEAFATVGPLAIEFFVSDDELLVNELAPRPHNSGHYTIEGCQTSQFEQHIRAALRLPLGATTLVAPTVMINLLGQHMVKFMEYLPRLSKQAHVHLYGKKAIRTNRKMGHVTFIDYDNVEVEHFLQSVIDIN
ncbi:5-(carboxyamino)imidazole ribonucleotide synthase [Culicoidibacter larvae]|uniref:N5-carboxyaminoimidazole ribonucleotide synthase n=1 Tax=Culicoidibacter larvae TaxID=2579976 RepID=A0A5R8QDB8_9FIRM|nr:5-(carboxyamino)imidazole ribonucleotide synthase [Culicoidibacter larvae]TLG74334.1 5-(carboxyamino)imidazole ribonucleotide synthase [Culicoidibacter larvae]